MELIEEIFVNHILLKSLDIIAEPDSINKLIIKIIENYYEIENKPTIDEYSRTNQVQLLKHWCQMNGHIFRSVN